MTTRETIRFRRTRKTAMPDLFSNIGIWDIILIVVVSVKGTFAAYIPHPRWKAFILLSPIPFTFAVLALGQPLDATNLSGLLVMLLYTFAVKFLYRQFKLPIVWAIILSALGYCVIGGILAMVIPKTETAFLIAAVAVSTVAAILHSAMPHPLEPKQQSSLPIWKKTIAIALVISFIVIIKSHLQGFMTVFPMVGVIVAYEARLSLYTVCRHIPVAMLGLVPMMTTCYVLQEHIGLVPALLAGWVVYLIILPLFVVPLWKKYDTEEDIRRISCENQSETLGRN